MKLKVEDLNVASFTTESTSAKPWDPYCCTGCDSGCGIIATGGGCESAGGDTGEGVCW